jgi:hypothetical protein
LHSIEPGILYIDYSLFQLRRAGIAKAYIVVSRQKLSPMTSALLFHRHGIDLVYVEIQPADSKSLAGSVLRGCKAAYRQHDHTKFVIVLPDTTFGNPDVVKEVTRVDPPCLALFDVPSPSDYDAVYGACHRVGAVTVKEPLFKHPLGPFQGVWGSFTLDYPAVLRLCRIMKISPSADSATDEHLMGALLNKDVEAGSRYYYLKFRGTYTDLGEWDRVNRHIAGMGFGKFDA